MSQSVSFGMKCWYEIILHLTMYYDKDLKCRYPWIFSALFCNASNNDQHCYLSIFRTPFSHQVMSYAYVNVSTPANSSVNFLIKIIPIVPRKSPSSFPPRHDQIQLCHRPAHVTTVMSTKSLHKLRKNHLRYRKSRITKLVVQRTQLFWVLRTPQW